MLKVPKKCIKVVGTPKQVVEFCQCGPDGTTNLQCAAPKTFMVEEFNIFEGKQVKFAPEAYNFVKFRIQVFPSLQKFYLTRSILRRCWPRMDLLIHRICAVQISSKTSTSKVRRFAFVPPRLKNRPGRSPNG